jgi:hypothetical protein
MAGLASPPELLSLHARDPGKYVELPRVKTVEIVSCPRMSWRKRRSAPFSSIRVAIV